MRTTEEIKAIKIAAMEEYFMGAEVSEENEEFFNAGFNMGWKAQHETNEYAKQEVMVFMEWMAETIIGSIDKYWMMYQIQKKKQLGVTLQNFVNGNPK